MCILRFKWERYANTLPFTWTVVYKYMTSHLNCSIQIHDWWLELYYTNTWPVTWTVTYKYMSSQLNRSIQMHYTVQVTGHVFVHYDSTERSCICILRFKWAVMYLYTTVQLRAHVFVCYGSSHQSCICILQSKWELMYLYNTVQVISHVTSKLNSGMQIHYRSLEP
jgi:hypothetical protein